MRQIARRMNRKQNSSPVPVLDELVEKFVRTFGGKVFEVQLLLVIQPNLEFRRPGEIVSVRYLDFRCKRKDRRMKQKGKNGNQKPCEKRDSSVIAVNMNAVRTIQCTHTDARNIQRESSVRLTEPDMCHQKLPAAKPPRPNCC